MGCGASSAQQHAAEPAEVQPPVVPPAVLRPSSTAPAVMHWPPSNQRPAGLGLRFHTSRIELDNAEMFIGTYQRGRFIPGLEIQGVNTQDLIYRVAPDEGGEISLCHDDLSTANEFTLLAGCKPGAYKVKIIHNTSSGEVVVATKPFKITEDWPYVGKYPRRWVDGSLQDFVTGATWGGGAAGPQNVAVIPASGTRSIVLAFVDTSTRRYPTGNALTTLQTTWSTSIVGPTGCDVYYNEVSYNTFTVAVNGGVQNVSLANDWASYFSMMSSPWPNNSFAASNGQSFVQQIVSAISGSVTFANNSTLIMVVRSAGAANADNFFWPQAWGGNFSVPGGSVNLNVLGMPDDWSTTRDTRTITETCSHELGHNIRLPDLYTNTNWGHSQAIIDRDITDWDLMSREGTLPHLTISQRMQLGWIQAAWVQSFDFSSATVPLDRLVSLSPVEGIGAPAAGSFKGIEIRIAEGWNYYFEFRVGQVMQIGDQTTPVANCVLGTDVTSIDFTAPISRPRVLRLQGGKTTFVAGEAYVESDATSSMAVSDFRMDVISITATTAQVRIRYGTNGRPDLYIRPWPGGGNWQSPDIEVRNARSATHPEWKNVPWVGHSNTVVATYRNRGPITCRNVTVSFFLKDFTIADAPEVHLGSDTKNVGPESSVGGVEFSTTWVPNSDGHKCIVVRTPLYIDTSVNPNIVEISDSNNAAQSNYSRYIAASASPAHRGIVSVTLQNPFPVPAYVWVSPQILGDLAVLYRLYLDETSAILNAGESKKVQLLLESKYDGSQFNENSRKYFQDVHIALTGYGMPYDNPHPVLLGGAQIAVGTGCKTKFSRTYASVHDGVAGTVATDRVPTQAAAGIVLITFTDVDTDKEITVSAVLDVTGSFARKPTFKFGKLTKVRFHYPGYRGFAPCDGDPLTMLNDGSSDMPVRVSVTDGTGARLEPSLSTGLLLRDGDPATTEGTRGITFVSLSGNSVAEQQLKGQRSNSYLQQHAESPAPAPATYQEGSERCRPPKS